MKAFEWTTLSCPSIIPSGIIVLHIDTPDCEIELELKSPHSFDLLRLKFHHTALTKECFSYFLCFSCVYPPHCAKSKRKGWTTDTCIRFYTIRRIVRHTDKLSVHTKIWRKTENHTRERKRWKRCLTFIHGNAWSPLHRRKNGCCLANSNRWKVIPSKMKKNIPSFCLCVSVLDSKVTFPYLVTTRRAFAKQKKNEFWLSCFLSVFFYVSFFVDVFFSSFSTSRLRSFNM